MVPITVGVASPRGSVAYDSLSRSLLASRGVYAVVGVSTETDSVDANRGVGVIVGFVLERTDATWIRRIRESGDATPVIAVCRPTLARFALAAGADGVIGPEDERLELERAIAACSRGGRWVPVHLEQSADRLEMTEESRQPAAEPPQVAAASVAAASVAAATSAPAVAALAPIEVVEADPTEIAEIVAIARSRASA